MPDPHETNRQPSEPIELPTVPPLPELPDAPKLQPNLPRREKPVLEESSEQYQRMGIAYTIPLALAAPIIALLLLGAWLDKVLHTSPGFTLGGALLGTISGFINMIRIANKLNK